MTEFLKKRTSPKVFDEMKDDPQNERLLEDIASAHAAWMLAMDHFNNAAPDVIDDAIYLLNAAEMRYEGLMRVARRRQLAVNMMGELTPGFATQTPSAGPPVDKPSEPKDDLRQEHPGQTFDAISLQKPVSVGDVL